MTVATNAVSRMSEAFMLGRLAIVPDLSGALWLPDESTLVVADLHLEKGSAYAARGVFLPPYDSTATLAALAAAVLRHAPARVIALGDSFHDRQAHTRISLESVSALRQLQTGRDWLWVTGNHDPQISTEMGGETTAMISIAGIALRHEPDEQETGFEIAGHLHPAAKVRMRGRALRRRCFALSPRRCVMPAMGAYAGGLNLRDRAFRPLFREGLSAHMLGDSRLFRIDERLLLPD
ncbi:ligase-associated DNA damage response endonuclease PdeM [Bosea lathyri]|uniref:Putative phosphoesterase n=1 Tax=Bosea lathyri TaxID=1036778 RepID=A0A1H5SJW5_9HYPH|nr:ligase-associated DNA damage response endonuclease PdeM [Bosea lathyri]SEF50886.1 putative phosphoesterase [Bosea lathyri]